MQQTNLIFLFKTFNCDFSKLGSAKIKDCQHNPWFFILWMYPTKLLSYLLTYLPSTYLPIFYLSIYLLIIYLHMNFFFDLLIIYISKYASLPTYLPSYVHTNPIYAKNWSSNVVIHIDKKIHESSRIHVKSIWHHIVLQSDGVIWFKFMDKYFWIINGYLIIKI
jgi:hypothetical protein